MDEITQPHDKLFKETFGRKEAAISFFKEYLPAHVTKRMDWESLQLEPGSFIDEDLKDSQRDLLYSIKLKENKCLVYLLFESQSSNCPLMGRCFLTPKRRKYQHEFYTFLMD